MQKTSIVIPCYNEKENIRILAGCFAKLASRYKLELILVDNGSEDGTGEEILKYEAKCPFMISEKVDVNQGYGYGILRGLQKATGSYLGWMHADLQSDPDIFRTMMEHADWENGDFLYKGLRKNRPVADTLFTAGMSLFESLFLHKALWDINAQPTLISRGFYERWKEPPYDFSLDLYTYYLAKIWKIRIRRFSSVQRQRIHGTSKWNTGMRARIRLIQRVLVYSRSLKKAVRK